MQRVVDAEVGVEAVRRGPGPEPDPGDIQALAPGRAQRHDLAVDEHRVALGDQAVRAQLDPLDRGVDVAGRPAAALLLAEHVPGLDRVADLEPQVAGLELADQRAAQIHERPVGGRIELDPALGQEPEHVLEVLPHPPREQELVVQARAPADQRVLVGALGQGRDQPADEQHLGDGHARVRGHLERAELDQALAAGRGPPVEQLVDRQLGAVAVAADVDEQITEQQIAEPRRGGLTPGAALERVGEGDLELVEALVPGLVDPRRLRGRADEQAREHVRERGVVLKEGDQAGEQLGPGRERAGQRRRPAEGQVVPAARAGEAAVEQVLLGVEPGVEARVVDGLEQADVVVGRRGRGDVDLEHPGVGGHGDPGQARARGRRVALEDDGDLEHLAHAIDDRDQLDEVGLAGQRGQEHEQRRVLVDLRPPLDADRRVHAVGRARGRLGDGELGLLAGSGPVVVFAGAGVLGVGVLDRRDRVGDPAERAERESEPGRTVAREQEQVLAAEAPPLGDPALRIAGVTDQREDPRGRCPQTLAEHAAEPGPLLAVLEREAQRVGVDGQPALEREEVPGVLVRRLEAVVELERGGEGPGEPLGRRALGCRPAGLVDRLPQGDLVGPADRVEGPARHALARVELAHPLHPGAAGEQPLAQLVGQLQARAPLARPERVAVPLGRVDVVAGVEGRLAAHGQGQAEGVELGVGPAPGREQLGPDLLGIGRGRARLVAEPSDAHLELDCVREHVGGAEQRRGEGGGRGGSEGDVTLGREQPRGRVEADPAGPGHVGLGPGVEVDDVVVEALGQVGEHALVGDLDQVAGHEARGDPSPAQQRDQEHGRVAAAPALAGEGLLGRPDPRLLADHVGDPFVGPPVDLDQGLDGVAAGRQGREELLEQRAGRDRGLVEGQERRELAAVLVGVGEAELLDPVVDEEVERVDRADLDRHLDEDVELADPLRPREGHLSDAVAVRIEGPADLLGLLAGEPVGLDRRLGVSGGVEAEGMRPEQGRLGVAVVASVLDQQAHSDGLRRRRLHVARAIATVGVRGAVLRFMRWSIPATICFRPTSACPTPSTS